MQSLPGNMYELLNDLLSGRENLFLTYRDKHVYRDVIDAVDKKLIEQVLSVTFGNKRRAAKLLGINEKHIAREDKKTGNKRYSL